MLQWGQGHLSDVWMLLMPQLVNFNPVLLQADCFSKVHYWNNPWSQCMCWTYCCTTIAAPCPKVITNSVVAAGVVVGSILLAGDQLLGVEELAVGPSPDLIHDSWLQVNEHGSVRKIRPSFVSLTSPHLVVVVVVAGFLFLTFSFCTFIYSALFLFSLSFHSYILSFSFLSFFSSLSFFLKLPCCLSPSKWSSFLTFVERFQISDPNNWHKATNPGNIWFFHKRCSKAS